MIQSGLIYSNKSAAIAVDSFKRVHLASLPTEGSKTGGIKSN